MATVLVARPWPWPLVGRKRSLAHGDAMGHELALDVGHVDIRVDVEAATVTRHRHTGRRH